MKVGRKKIIILGAVTAVTITTALAIRALNTPAVGTVTQVMPATEKAPDNKTATGKYILFKYPARYSEASNKNQSASLEYWILVTRFGQGTGQTGQISLNITNLPEGGVKEDSSYKNIHAFSDKYKLTDKSINNEPVIIATRMDPSYERTALWPHKKLLLTATLTSSVDDVQLNKEFDELLNSVQFQNF